MCNIQYFHTFNNKFKTAILLITIKTYMFYTLMTKNSVKNNLISALYSRKHSTKLIFKNQAKKKQPLYKIYVLNWPEYYIGCSRQVFAPILCLYPVNIWFHLPIFKTTICVFLEVPSRFLKHICFPIGTTWSNHFCAGLWITLLEI